MFNTLCMPPKTKQITSAALKITGSKIKPGTGRLRSESRTEMAKETNSDIKSMTFEAALKELEQIVARLEHGEVPLEESIQIYERGEALRSHCDQLLTQAEAKVEKIAISPDGSAGQTQPMEIE